MINGSRQNVWMKVSTSWMYGRNYSKIVMTNGNY